MPGRPPFSAYCQDESGAVTVFITIMFVLLLALGGLIFDIGRVYDIHSESQAYVDNVALAAAAELDGAGGAIARAIRAASGDAQHAALLNPGNRLSLSGDKLVNVQSLVFLESLASDPSPGTRSPVADDVVLCTYETGAVTCNGGLTEAEADKLARFVLVNATVESENFTLFPIAGAFAADAPEDAAVQPQAIAGFKKEICNFPPVSFCNPYESPSPPYGGDFTPTIGQQILLKMQGSGAQWTPGDFGLLQPTAGAGGGACGNNSGANFIRCVLAVINPGTRCVDATVDVQPGQASGPVKDGFNLRFDIFDAPLQNKTNDPNFAPSANVTKGRVHNNNQCSYNQLSMPPAASMTVPLPRDSCFADATCSNGRFGNGVSGAQLQSYWTTNHGGMLPAGLATRYDAYRYEIDNNLIPDKSALNPQGENGRPTCATSGISSAKRDRRILTVAVINCLENNVHGNTSGIPVVAFGRMFMTEPVGMDGSSNNDLYAEMLGLAKPGGDDGVLHEFPVLYR